MIEEKKFDQRDVYANHVRIYRSYTKDCAMKGDDEYGE